MLPVSVFMLIAIDIREAGHEKTGKGWYTFNIVKGLMELDSENTYRLYTDSPQNPFDNLPKNFEIRCLSAPSWKWHFKVLKDIKEHPVTLFFAPTSYIIPSLAPSTIKTIITVHDLVAFMFPSTHNKKAVIIERLTLKKALTKASHSFVVSDNTKHDLMKRFGYPESKMTITSCAPSDFYKKPLEITSHEKKEITDRLNLPEKFLLAVSTLEPRKNFSVLLKSFVIIKRKFPEYKLVIVGKKGWNYQSIDETLKHYQLQNDVILTGYLPIEDIKKLYHLAKAFVFPSLYEGFGIPPLEAMASGCPVVASNVSSLPEVVGEAGLLVDPQNAYKIAEAVISLIGNEEARHMFIERGKKQAEKFNWTSSAQKALQAFQLIGNS